MKQVPSTSGIAPPPPCSCLTDLADALVAPGVCGVVHQLVHVAVGAAQEHAAARAGSHTRHHLRKQESEGSGEACKTERFHGRYEVPTGRRDYQLPGHVQCWRVLVTAHGMDGEFQASEVRQ